VSPRRPAAAHVAALYGAINPTLPSRDSLRRFAAETDLTVAHHPGAWTDVLDAAASLLTDAGLPVPPRPRALGRGVTRQIVVPARPGTLGGAHPETTRDEAIQALREWDRQQAGRARTLRQYQAWQRGKPYPALNTIQRHGSFSELKTEAIRLNSSGTPGLPPLRRPVTLTVTPDLLCAVAAGPTRTVASH
jgi:hypothetical protein